MRRDVDPTSDPSILVAYDGSRATRRALEIACGLADPASCSLDVVIATRRPRLYGESMVEANESLVRGQQAGRRLLNEVEAFCLDRGLAPRVTVCRGRALAELIRAARQNRYDVAVLPTRGGAATLMALLARRRAQRYVGTVVVPGLEAKQGLRPA